MAGTVRVFNLFCTWISRSAGQSRRARSWLGLLSPLPSPRQPRALPSASCLDSLLLILNLIQFQLLFLLILCFSQQIPECIKSVVLFRIYEFSLAEKNVEM